MRFADKVAIVTGSGRGIGREIAARFASEGARTVVADVQGENARTVAAELTAAGGEALAVRVDITDPTQVECLIQETLAHFGRLDVLVNNAGVGLNKPFLTTTLEEWNRQLRVNLTGTFLCAQAAARVMVRQGAGRIINIASISGQRGGQGRAAYGASKAGIILLTKVMAVELAPHGVSVNAIAPGPVVTEMSNGTHTEATRRAYHERIPLRRYGREHEIAAAALFLASEESSFVNGHILNVDGGFGAAGLLFDPEEQSNGQTGAFQTSPLTLPSPPDGGEGRVRGTPTEGSSR
ncbi:MAG: 3-oxoacyl-ACP reductase FabG [Gemmataceae bacterium]|nr:3-oxoacyl-ACP reductase FabG [Gemmataceae bacterium]